MSDSGILADASSLAACRRGCLSCARCSVISYSAINRDCSWYAHCRISDLRRPPKEARDYVSVRVKPMPAAPAARWADAALQTAQKLRVAIATLHFASSRSRSSACALRQWCERVGLLARALRALGWDVRTLILTEPPSAVGDAHGEAATRECAEGVLEPLEPRLVQLVRRCQARTPASGDSHPVRLMPILKFGAVRLVAYDYVLYADSDVALLPEADLLQTARRWAEMAPALRTRTWPELLSHADSMSPVNGGLFIVRPSMRRYETGLRVLHRCTFNASHGWDLIGPPRSLGVVFRHADGTAMPHRGGDTGDAPLLTDAYRRDNWAFVGADSDQGFLFHVYHVLHGSHAAMLIGLPAQHRGV